MKQKQQSRSKWLTVRLTEAEYLQIQKLAEQTTSRTVSEYARKLVLGKPVVMRYRNQSLDDFVGQMSKMRDGLSSIGNNFNQAVRRLHSLRYTADLQQWIIQNEEDKTKILQQMTVIFEAISKAYKLWSQE